MKIRQEVIDAVNRTSACGCDVYIEVIYRITTKEYNEAIQSMSEHAGRTAFAIYSKFPKTVLKPGDCYMVKSSTDSKPCVYKNGVPLADLDKVDIKRHLSDKKAAIKSKSDGSTASYYELPEGATELQHLISYKNMNAQMGEIFRASYRYGEVEHSEKLRDAKKIKFYVEAEIKRLENGGE